MLIRRLLFLGAIGVLLAAGPALAAGPTTISKNTTTPQATSTDGDITINSGIKLDVNVAGPAAKIDSVNSIFNKGTISNTAATGAIGVELNGGGAGSQLDNGGIITVNGKGAAGGIGIKVDGAGYTGNIVTDTGSNIVVTGDNSIGLAVFSPLIGNITLSGSAVTTGQDAIGVITTSQITGHVIVAGYINTKGIATPSTSMANPQSGSAFAIGAGITGGILIDGPLNSADTTSPTAGIQSQGASPTFEISQAVATAAGGAAAPITIGVLVDPAAVLSGYSIINRGGLSALGTDPGVDATTILIAGDTGGDATTLVGGFYNRGTIYSTANTGKIAANVATANATTIEIGSGAVLNASVGNAAFQNDGVVRATAAGLDDGTATALQIDTGATLPSLINNGTIQAVAAEQLSGKITNLTLVACAICDASGTLSYINNAGTVEAQAGTAATQTVNHRKVSVINSDDGNHDLTTAVDVSANTSGVTFVNTGAVNGDILFGSGGDVLDVTTLVNTTTHDVIESGTVIGNIIDFGGGTNNRLIVDGEGTSVSGIIKLASGGTLDIEIATGAATHPGGALTTSSAQATTLAVGATGSVTFVTGQTAPNGGAVIVTTGNATFDPAANIALAFDGVLPSSGNYVLLNAGGTLTVSAATLSAVHIPWLYDGSVALFGSNEIVFNFNQKTPAELGLNANQTAILQPALAAAALDPKIGSALLNLGSVALGKQALDALMPDITGDVRTMMIALTDQATGAVGARQRTLTEYANTSAGLQTWGQEFVNTVNQKATPDVFGYNDRGFGFAIGADTGSPKNGRYGASFTFFTSDLLPDAPLSEKTFTQWYMLSLYSNWRGHVLFFNTQANAAYGELSNTRKVTIDTLTRTASGQWSDYMGSGGISTGLIFNAGSIVFMPQLNMDALYLEQGGYTEYGGGGIDLTLGSRTDKSLRGFVGLVIRDDISLDDGYMQPEFRAGWSHEFLNSLDGVPVAFVSVPNQPFRLSGHTLDASRFVGGFSLSFGYLTWSAGLNYDVTYSTGLMVQSGTLTLTGRI